MENDRGDLADIVRAAGGRSGPPHANFDPVVSRCHLPSQSVVFLERTETPTNNAGEYLLNLRDPLPDQYTGVEFFYGAEAMVAPAKADIESSSDHGGGGRSLVSPELQSGEQEIDRPCNNFSRVLQISPGGSRRPFPLSPRLIKPSPAVAREMMTTKLMNVSSSSAAGPVDHSGGVQILCPQTPGVKRRKNQAKKVVCIPAPAAASSRPSGEVVPSDLWAWRKYGQKPIKGSPYPSLFLQSSVPWLLSRFKNFLYVWFPKADGDFMDIRGYYRCSSSKGCSARKQVERSRTDPNMLVITYTSEHNHPWPTQRNALAGSTRSHPFKNALKIPGDDVLKSPTAPKEERREATTSNAHPDLEQEQEEEEMDKPTEDDDFNQNMHRSYKPMIPEADQPDDFFADLAELETDPMSLIFSKGHMDAKPDEERGDTASDTMMDIFDWAGSS
ncbi:WRKY [Musa troglodytarum]|uniref:WRKY n=1 Tax=Musa troglodytarum TaxID=320322 RepID=A0A9E7F902_9LILI|nr:WRKY [Musa troglodytarum]